MPNPQNLRSLATLPKAERIAIAASGGKAKTGSKSIKVMLREMLEEYDRQNGGDGQATRPLIATLLKKSLKGENIQATVEAMDRLEGKVTQNVDQKVESTQVVILKYED